MLGVPVFGSGIDEIAGGKLPGAEIIPGGVVMSEAPPIGPPPMGPNGTIDPGGPEFIGPKLFMIGFMLPPGVPALSGGVFGAS